MNSVDILIPSGGAVVFVRGGGGGHGGGGGGHGGGGEGGGHGGSGEGGGRGEGGEGEGLGRAEGEETGSDYHTAGVNWYQRSDGQTAIFPMGFWIGAVLVVIILFIVGRVGSE